MYACCAILLSRADVRRILDPKIVVANLHTFSKLKYKGERTRFEHLRRNITTLISRNFHTYKPTNLLNRFSGVIPTCGAILLSRANVCRVLDSIRLLLPTYTLFNRPGAAGAVLQTALSLIN